MNHARIDSPFGPMLICGDEKGLSGLYFFDQKDCPSIPQGGPVGSDAPVSESLQTSDAALRALRPIRRMGEGQAQMTLFAGDSASSGAQSEGNVSQRPSNSGTKLTGTAVSPGRQYCEPQWLQEDTPVEVQRLFTLAQAQLAEYFSGKRTGFDLPLNLLGTEFQVQVWKALCQVPYGALASYGELAAMAGLGPSHGRAVGTAVGRNPVSIVVPCHRIIGSNRTLTGYTGGLSRKVALLELEGFAFA